MSILQMKTLRHKELKQLGQGCTATKKQSQNLNSDNIVQENVFLTL